MRTYVYLIIDETGVRHMRQNEPKLEKGQIAVKLYVNVPDEVFRQFIPTAEITLTPPTIIQPMIEIDPQEVDNGD